MSESEAYEMLRTVVRPVIAKAPLPTPAHIRETIAQFRVIPTCLVSDEEAERLARDIESRLDIQMTIGSMVQEKGFVEWYPGKKAKITPFYWDRYRMLLEEEDLPAPVIATIDQVTDRITGLLQDPEKLGEWQRRGMVVGHVQSGKTANYIGLITKAADAGYKLIVVIAGIHNNLRNQTQKRIDEGFVGRDSGKPNKPYIGVSRFSTGQTPITLTNATSDFNAGIAEAAGMEIKSLAVPLVLVIKKNTHTLRNLIRWLKAHNTGWTKSLVDAPMLLIDDEADNASVNTSANPGEATRINELIRDLLNLFNKKCYVGYTATPFANIFIDPDTNDEMLKEDLFPKDFIVTLDAPTNYFGASRIFQDESGSAHLRDIVDNAEHLPVVHKQAHVLTALPESLKLAVRTFILARAVRILRGQGRKHTSMLVNASRFTNVQKQLRNLIHDYLDKVVRAIRHEGGKPDKQALANEHLAELKAAWELEFSSLEWTWADVKGVLLEAGAPIQIVEVNSASSGSLVYSDHMDDGLQVIAVGGFSLSRGLTLEGLTVSYFLRNSLMYDTLLQMGRWFGYRPGYEDLCRIWMPAEAQGWYEHISESIDELREEMRRMEQAKLTPAEFGLRVRTHPDSLIVTARNKMRTAQLLPVRVGLSGRFIETYALSTVSDHLAQNRAAALRLIEAIRLSGRTEAAPEGGRYRLWSGVEAELVIEFIESFRNHDRSLPTQSKPVAAFIAAGATSELERWDVAVVGKSDRDGSVDPDLGVKCQSRTAGLQSRPGDFVLVGEKNRVSSRGVERIGVDENAQRKAEEDYGPGPNYPDGIFRAVRPRPLLLIQPLELRLNGNLVSSPPPIAWGISFPPTKFDFRTVEYAVNTTWWREYVGLDDEADDEFATDAA